MNDRQSRSALSVGRRFLRFACGFWSGKSAGRAFRLTAAILVLVLLQIGSQVALNGWNRLFFDALERKAAPDLLRIAAWLPLVVVFSALAVSSFVSFRILFQIRWREWVTERLTGWWIADQRYYRLNLIAPEQSVPEYRIAEDVRLSIEPLVEFALGLVTAFITAATFAAILWQVAGAADFELFGIRFHIPAYMAFAAVVYAIIASTAAYLVGKPYVAKVGEKNEAEAQFRAAMARLRENAESIALIKGDEEERSIVRRAYKSVFDHWVRIARHQGYMGLVLNTNGAIFAIIPLLLVAPKYVAGSITLGGVMQVVAAFSAVQGALIWFVDNIVRLAEWLASARRVTELIDVLDEIDDGARNLEEIKLGISEDDSIRIDDLKVADRGGRVVIADASAQISPKEKVLLMGPSGSGKSTLIRAIAGLWPWGSGSIRVPKGRTIAFVPQRPYVPTGSLRTVLCYPEDPRSVPEKKILAAIARCGLDQLVKSLDNADHWDRILSGGERQRVAFARLLIQKPEIIVMDEATSALDEEGQHSMLSLLQDELSDSTVISVGHRPGIDAFHDRVLHLAIEPQGAELRDGRQGENSFSSWFRRLRIG